MEYYAGIGSRKTPHEVLDFFEKVALFLGMRNFTLRSGGANGADKHFEDGCDKVNGEKEIYLPWGNFEGSKSNLIVKDDRSFDIAQQFHPYWNNLSQGARKLQARNTHQVLGFDLNTFSNFVICWTENGKGQGGTGQAIRIANHYNIPVFDAGNYDSLTEVKLNLRDFLLEHSNLDESDLKASQ